MLWSSCTTHSRNGLFGAARRSGQAAFSSLDLLVIGFLNSKDQKVRAADISFALKIEDTYTVQYALKKLAAAHLVESQRSGKETLFQLTSAGRNLYKRYSIVRSNFLLDAVAMISANDLDRLASVLRTIQVSMSRQRATPRR
ncbi:winged helix DNA-binding protein [Bradyrhizobium sp. LeoA1S1]